MLHLVRHLREVVEIWAGLGLPIPRTVIMPTERVTHAFRRELALDIARRPLLVGTRFACAVEVARERILRSGMAPPERREALLPLAIETLLNGSELEGRLRYFKLDELRSGAGFAEAFAETLGDLSAANVAPDAVRRAAERGTDDVSRRRMLDVATIMEAVRLDAVDRHEVLRRGASAPGAERGSYFALLAREPDASELDFLVTLPGLRAAYLVASPPRPEAEEVVDRIAARLGGRATEPPGGLRDTREISLVRRYFLARPEEQADALRPVSSGPDGSVHVEIHAGVAEELAAARDWVSEQVRAGWPLERIAVIVPARDPYSGMVYDRLSSLPWGTEEPPIYVAGGLPATDTLPGQRMLGLLDAVEAGLRVGEFARLLPWLKFEEPVGPSARTHLSAGEAGHIVWNCGTLGGSPERRADGERWGSGLARLVAEMARLAAIEAPTDRLEREVRNARRILEPARAVLTAVEELVALNSLASGGTPLDRLWLAFHEFWQRRVASFDPQALVAALGAGVSALSTLDGAGVDPLRVIRDALVGLRRPVGRFGEPRVFVGTIADSVALPFDAVRVVGLAEGGVAGAPVEDPLLPDSDRRLLATPIRLAERGPLRELHDLSRLTQHAAEILALSAPRVTVDGTVREPSSIYLEVAAALRRPNARTGTRDPSALRRSALDRDYVGPGRSARLSAVRITPTRPSTDDVEQFVLACERDRPGPLDGLLRRAPDVAPSSASAIQTFLRCPHRFLFERCLHWEEPEALPDVHALDALTYGTLFHSVMECFFGAGADDFYAHRGSYEEHLRRAGAEADRLLDELVRFYPLEGNALERERERLRDDVEHALDHEWKRQGLAVACIERPFGYPEPVSIGGLPVRGFIDRVDLQGGYLSVMDWKTGKPKLRRDVEPPDPRLDVQLALYSLVARVLAADWKTPPPQAAGYLYVSPPNTPERKFDGDAFTALLKAGELWLDVVRRLGESGAYPRTPAKDDCEYCPFRHVCGPVAPVRAKEKLRDEAGAVGDFLSLRRT